MRKEIILLEEKWDNFSIKKLNIFERKKGAFFMEEWDIVLEKQEIFFRKIRNDFFRGK